MTGIHRAGTRVDATAPDAAPLLSARAGPVDYRSMRIGERRFWAGRNAEAAEKTARTCWRGRMRRGKWRAWDDLGGGGCWVMRVE
jgi:hypothetical protein